MVANVEDGPVDHRRAFWILAVTVGDVPVVLKLNEVADSGLPAPEVTTSTPSIRWFTSGRGERDTFCVVVLETYTIGVAVMIGRLPAGAVTVGVRATPTVSEVQEACMTSGEVAEELTS